MAEKPVLIKKKTTNKGAYQSRLGLSTVSRSVSSTAQFARKILDLGGPSTWLFDGPVGAGKTTFVREVLRMLGVRRSVTSPTFTLVKSYRLPKSGWARQHRWKQAVHVDAYRIKHPSEHRAILADLLDHDSDTLLLVEWPKKLPRTSWGLVWHITFRHHRLGRLLRARQRRY